MIMTIDKNTGYRQSNLMKDLLGDNSLLLPALSRFDIPFGFGDSTVGQVCADNDVDTDTFLCVCNLVSGYPFDLSKVSLPSLMGYLKRAHTSFLDVTLPKIRHYLIDAINYRLTDEVSLLLMKFYDDYVQEVRKHMEYENNVIFTYVDRLLSDRIDDSFDISQYSESHDDTAKKLNELKNIFIYHYKQRDNARLSGALLDIIVCERDMLSHFEVESRIFVPMVMELENKLRTSHPSAGRHHADDPTPADDTSVILSRREQDIIRCIAKGKVNKEIADELCISVHTVATHRKNISSKLDIHSPAGLTIYAILNHLVDLNEVTPY